VINSHSEAHALSADELAAEDATPLPSREAMSLVGGSLFDGGGLTNDPSVMQQPGTEGAPSPLPPEGGLDGTALPLKNPFVN